MNQQLRYCPQCAAEGLSRRELRFECGKCGLVFYMNVAAAAAALITDGEGRLLVTRRAAEPAKGTLDLPGGFIDPDETAEEGIRREIREELNLELDSVHYFFSAPNRYEYKGILYFTLDMAFECTAKNLDALGAGDDVEEVLFIDPATVDLNDFGLASIRELVLRYRDLKREP